MTLPETSRLLCVRVTVCAAFLAGIALSMYVWTLERLFPIAPVLAPLPAALDSVLFGVFVVTLILFAVCGKRKVAQVTIIATAVLILGDITRFQPWVYLYLLIIGCFAFAPKNVMDVARFLLACTYLWSGASKLNLTYVTEVFPRLLDILHVPTLYLSIAALLTAFLEAVCGIGLLFPRTRRVSLVFLVLMHIAILLLLYEIQWNSVVWPWNVAMSILLCLLFWKNPNDESTVNCQLSTAWYPKFIFIVLGILPSLNLLGWWDSYPSMNLYSGNTDRASIETSEGNTDVLQWSMNTMNVPPYPEERVFRHLARSLCPGIVLTVTTQVTLFRPKETHTYDCSQL